MRLSRRLGPPPRSESATGLTKPEGGAQPQRAENLCLRERLCHCGLQWRRRRDGRNSIGKLDPMGHQIESLDVQSERRV